MPSAPRRHLRRSLRRGRAHHHRPGTVRALRELRPRGRPRPDAAEPVRPPVPGLSRHPLHRRRDGRAGPADRPGHLLPLPQLCRQAPPSRLLAQSPDARILRPLGRPPLRGWGPWTGSRRRSAEHHQGRGQAAPQAQRDARSTRNRPRSGTGSGPGGTSLPRSFTPPPRNGPIGGNARAITFSPYPVSPG